MKIYLAASYRRQVEMREHKEALQGLGHEVTSRWIYETGPDPLTAATLGPDPAAGTPHGERDVEDIRAADAVIVSTGVPSTTGGLHTEFGLALGLGKRLVLVGPRENVFHTLPGTEWYPDWDSLLATWSQAAADGSRTTGFRAATVASTQIPRGTVPPGQYAGGARSPIVHVLLCPPCAGYAPMTSPGYTGFLTGQCQGCGEVCCELHRFPARIESVGGCKCRSDHPRVCGDLPATEREGAGAA